MAQDLNDIPINKKHLDNDVEKRNSHHPASITQPINLIYIPGSRYLRWSAIILTGKLPASLFQPVKVQSP